MKNTINSLLTIIAPLTSAPTAWAIFAGITNRSAFPVLDWIAFLGAVSILFVDIAAALQMSDAYYFRQSSLDDNEKLQAQPLWWSLLILITAILSEITLSLVIVVYREVQAWGVLVFPLMTLAGAFTVAARIDLTERERVRKEAREEVKKKKEDAKEKRKATREANKKAREAEKANQAKPIKATIQTSVSKTSKVAILEEIECPYCSWPDGEKVTKKQLAGHMRKHPISSRTNHKGGKEETKEATWVCSQCGTVNNSEREECRNCEMPRKIKI